jgi:chemotaxis signal transduction protein
MNQSIPLVIFTVQDNQYALHLAKVWRIIEPVQLKPIPKSNKLIDGVMPFEDNIIKVVNFRKILNISSYEKQLLESLQFATIKHEEFLESLRETVLSDSSYFPHELSPYKCALGKLIYSFNSSSDMNNYFKDLKYQHSKFHNLASKLLQIKDQQEAISFLEQQIVPVYKKLKHHLSSMDNLVNNISQHTQKFIIYKNNFSSFALKVDKIIDIVNINSSIVKEIDQNQQQENHNYLKISGALEWRNNLITIIESIDNII